MGADYSRRTAHFEAAWTSPPPPRRRPDGRQAARPGAWDWRQGDGGAPEPSDRRWAAPTSDPQLCATSAAAALDGGPAGAILNLVWLRVAGPRRVKPVSETSRLAIVVGSVREGRFRPSGGCVGRRTGTRPRRVRRRRRRPRRGRHSLLPVDPPKFAGGVYPRPAGVTDLTSSALVASGRGPTVTDIAQDHLRGRTRSS